MYQPNNPYPQNNWNVPYNQNYQKRRARGRGGCVGTLALLVLLAGASFLAYQYLQTNPVPSFFQNSLFSSESFFIVVLVLLGLGVCFAALARASRGSLLGKLMSGLATLTILAFAGATLLWITFLNPHIGMTRTSFTTTYVSIFNHNKVTFQNPANGVTQTLCIGTDQRCEPLQYAHGPSQVAHGLVIQPGQSVDVEFDSIGNYYITSQNTPHMNLKIVVSRTGH